MSEEFLRTLADLVLILAPLSLVSIGGANTILPEVHRQVVNVHGWMTDADFADLFALARAAQGPNVLLYGLVGWKVAGVVGALVADFALSGPRRCWPSSRCAPGAASTTRPGGGPSSASIAQVAVGLMFASAYTLVGAADTTAFAYLVTAAAAALTLWTRAHPLALLLAAAALSPNGVAVRPVLRATRSATGRSSARLAPHGSSIVCSPQDWGVRGPSLMPNIGGSASGSSAPPRIGGLGGPPLAPPRVEDRGRPSS